VLVAKGEVQLEQHKEVLWLYAWAEGHEVWCVEFFHGRLWRTGDHWMFKYFEPEKARRLISGLRAGVEHHGPILSQILTVKSAGNRAVIGMLTRSVAA
jgi:hypothetical protein